MDLYLFFQWLQSCENRMPMPMPSSLAACPVACFWWAAGRVSSVTSPPLPDRHQPAGAATENLQVPKFARRKTNPPPPILLCWVAPVRDRATVLPSPAKWFLDDNQLAYQVICIRTEHRGHLYLEKETAI